MELKPGRDYIGVGVGTVILNGKKEILLVKRSKNSRNETEKWNIPGGAIEFGEMHFEAAKREALEETGCEIIPLRLLAVLDYFLEKEKQHWISFIVEAKIAKGEPKIMEPEKHDDMKWFPLSKLPKPEEMTMTNNLWLKEIQDGKIKL